MASDDKIRYEKLQYDINREAAKVPVLLSGKIDKDAYFLGEEESVFNQSRMIEQVAEFAYSPLEFKKTNKQRN